MTNEPRRNNEPVFDFRSEDGQTMAEYSVVLTLIIVVFGIGAFFVLAAAVTGQLARVTSFLT
jgi:Flp pilus assembly pilin Flp